MEPVSVITNIKCAGKYCGEVLRSGANQMAKCCCQYFHNHCADKCRSQHECDCGKPCSFESATIKIDENLCVVDKNEKVETERKMEDLEEQIRTLRDRIRSLEGENEGLIEDAMAYRIMRDNVVAADAAHNIVMPANRPEIGNNGNVNGNGHYSDSD